MATAPLGKIWLLALHLHNFTHTISGHNQCLQSIQRHSWDCENCELNYIRLLWKYLHHSMHHRATTTLLAHTHMGEHPLDEFHHGMQIKPFFPSLKLFQKITQATDPQSSHRKHSSLYLLPAMLKIRWWDLTFLSTPWNIPPIKKAACLGFHLDCSFRLNCFPI